MHSVLTVRNNKKRKWFVERNMHAICMGRMNALCMIQCVCTWQAQAVQSVIDMGYSPWILYILIGERWNQDVLKSRTLRFVAVEKMTRLKHKAGKHNEFAMEQAKWATKCSAKTINQHHKIVSTDFHLSLLQFTECELLLLLLLLQIVHCTVHTWNSQTHSQHCTVEGSSSKYAPWYLIQTKCSLYKIYLYMMMTISTCLCVCKQFVKKKWKHSVVLLCCYVIFIFRYLCCWTIGIFSNNAINLASSTSHTVTFTYNLT